MGLINLLRPEEGCHNPLLRGLFKFEGNCEQRTIPHTSSGLMCRHLKRCSSVTFLDYYSYYWKISTERAAKRVHSYHIMVPSDLFECHSDLRMHRVNYNVEYTLSSILFAGNSKWYTLKTSYFRKRLKNTSITLNLF